MQQAGMPLRLFLRFRRSCRLSQPRLLLPATRLGGDGSCCLGSKWWWPLADSLLRLLCVTGVSARPDRRVAGRRTCGLFSSIWPLDWRRPQRVPRRRTSSARKRKGPQPLPLSPHATCMGQHGGGKMAGIKLPESLHWWASAPSPLYFFFFFCLLLTAVHCGRQPADSRLVLRGLQALCDFL